MIIPKTYEKYLTGVFALLMHLPPLTLFYTGVAGQDWVVLGLLYLLNTLALGGAMHRYFAHRGYKTSRPFQFFLAVSATLFFADVIGFTGRHRLHHKLSDGDADVHSPRRGFWQCWIGSLLDDGRTDEEVLRMTPDLNRYPELMWLHRWSFVPGFAMGTLVWWLGGYTMFACSYCLIFLLSFHGPSALNYLGHQNRNRRYDTPDLSSNSIFLGIVLFGEGWHNNHHHFPNSARAGFFWYEFDGIFYMLKALSWTGLIWDLREPSEEVKYPALRGAKCA